MTAPAPTRRQRLTSALLVLALALAAIGAILRLANPAIGNPPGRVVLLSAEWCGYCTALRRHFDANGVPYTELDTERSWRGALGFMALGAHGVPVTLVGDQRFAGFQPEKIDAALREAGYDLPAPWAPDDGS